MIWCLRILWAVGAILLFGISVLIHEYGHFLAARLLGFQVDAFSIGFGPAIWQKKVRGVTYRIGCIPLGGYVALPQLDPSEMDAIQGKNSDANDSSNHEHLPPVAAWKRIVVAVAGPLGNIVLAVVVAFLIYAFSTPENFGGVGVTVGFVEPGGKAAEAGLAVGDTFRSINGNKITCWEELSVECILGANTNTGIRATVERAGKPVDLVLPVSVDAKTGYAFIPGISPRLKCRVGKVIADSAAEEAGLCVGDEIVSIDDIDLNGPADMVDRITAGGEKPISLRVKRFHGGAIDTVSLTPRFNQTEKRALIGIVFGESEAANQSWMMYRRPDLQLKNDAKSVFRILRALFAPREKGEAKRAAKGMGGAVTLFYMFWMQIQAGIIQTIAFLRYLCVNLAILNLLPLPVLDGGHVLFALIEMITGRKPSSKMVGWIYNVFALLLIGLMAVLIMRDVWRFKAMHDRAREKEASTNNVEIVVESAAGTSTNTVETVDEP